LAALAVFAASSFALGACGGSSDDTGDGGGTAAFGPEKVELYFTAGEQFKPVRHEVEDSGSAPAEATRALLEGPEEIVPQQAEEGEADTLIPKGTKLEDLKVDGSGEAVVDLSEEFLSGIPPQSSKQTRAEKEKVTARLAQVTYTLTSFEQVDTVKVRSGGLTVQQDRGDFSKPPTVPKAPKVRGGVGASVKGARSLQEKLANLGYLPRSGVDGVAGYQTEQAVMAFQSWEGLARDGDAGPATRAALETAKRPRPKAKNPRRFMEVHLAKGVLLLVKDGRTVRAVHVSGGAPATYTPTGRYPVFRKELMSWSVPFSAWLPYASYFNNGIAFHEYPDVPPYPASHGCVRVPTPDAQRVYEFARMNTVVVVRS